MKVTSIISDVPVADIDAARYFYTGFLGLRDEEFNLGWVARFTQPESRACIQVVTRDATAPEDAVASLKVDDVEEAYRLAREAGYEIVHPLSRESWGVYRFFVRAPDGNVYNIAQEH